MTAPQDKASAAEVSQAIGADKSGSADRHTAGRAVAVFSNVAIDVARVEYATIEKQDDDNEKPYYLWLYFMGRADPVARTFTAEEDVRTLLRVLFPTTQVGTPPEAEPQAAKSEEISPSPSQQGKTE